MFQRVPHRLARKTVVRAIPIQITLMHRDSALIGRAKPGSRLDERVEHHLKVESRAAYDLEHVGGRGLLLKGFAQLVQQPGVLDGNDGLGGEVFYQFDLLVGERPHLLAIESDHTNQLVILQHRHTKYSSEFAEFNRGDRRWMTVEVGLLLLDVSDVRDLFGGRGATNRSIR